jgi:endonuclease/exonuclease/phosphatase family metal-dependent hydrolase
MSAIETAPPTSSMTSQAKPHRWRPSLFTLALAAVLLAGLGYGIANWEWPAGPAAGSSFAGAINTSTQMVLPSRFRVATFNIHGGFGMDGVLDLQRTATALQGADFVGLNEVRGPGWQDSRNQAEQLGTLLGMNWLFAPTETTWSGPHFGQGLLSRWPVSSWKRVPFGRRNGNGYRNYVECEVPIASGKRALRLTILVTHLDRKTDRQDQLQVIIRRFLEVPQPAILMGDLNSKRTEPQLIALAREPGVIDCFGQSFQNDLARKRIDWVFTRGLDCKQSELKSTSASDHPVGWAELELPKTAVDSANSNRQIAP